MTLEKRIEALEVTLDSQAPENRPIFLAELVGSIQPGAYPLDPRRPCPIGDLIAAMPRKSPPAYLGEP